MNTEKHSIDCIIMDDEIEACDRLESLLNKIEFISVMGKFTNAEKGIEEIIKNLPELVFLDIEMPRINGFEIIKMVRKAEVFPTFIFVTGYNQYAIKAIRNAAFDYLLKPVDIDELKEAIIRFKVSQNEQAKIFLPSKLKKEYNLTDREIEVVNLLLEGKSSAEIAEKLFLSKHTVDTHRRNIIEKMRLKSTNELLSKISNL